MERRRHPRFKQNEPVLISVLGEHGGTFEGSVVDASASGMRVESAPGLRSGALVKIEGKDTLLLGEVLYCTQLPDGIQQSGIQLTRALYGLAELRRLNGSLIDSGPSSSNGSRAREKEEAPARA